MGAAAGPLPNHRCPDKFSGLFWLPSQCPGGGEALKVDSVRFLFIAVLVAALSFTASTANAGKGGKGGKGKGKQYVVCKHGCKYKSVQDAVDDSGRNAVVKVEPGKYVEGVLVRGAKHAGLTITGTSKNPKKVILEGKNAKSPAGGPAQHGIEAINVPGLTIKNMTARNFAANGFFVRDSNASETDKKFGCRDYLLKNLFASYNRAYGLYAFGCKGGRMTRSTGIGHGDSAFYVGATPRLKKPDWTKLDHLDGHGNVQGYTGTNARWIEITESNFYNNGIGIVPNTLDSEPYEPATTGRIHNNNIFWNNYNYFLPQSKVKTISGGLGEIGGQTINFPTGVGVIVLGAVGYRVYDNNIFGNFKWGVAIVSNPLNEGDNAISVGNETIDNSFGRGGTDPNAVDLFSQGSGTGNCFSANGAVTMDPSSSTPNNVLYPPCPAPGVGTGDSLGDAEQFGDLVGYVTTTPPENQECSWTKSEHPPFKKYKPQEVPGANCPE